MNAEEPLQLHEAVGVLEHDGKPEGWIAAIVDSFWGLARPFGTQKSVWFLVTWADGRRERIEEDYPPYALVPEVVAGIYTSDVGVRYAVRWLTGVERQSAWETHGIHGPASRYM